MSLWMIRIVYYAYLGVSTPYVTLYAPYKILYDVWIMIYFCPIVDKRYI